MASSITSVLVGLVLLCMLALALKVLATLSPQQQQQNISQSHLTTTFWAPHRPKGSPLLLTWRATCFVWATYVHVVMLRERSFTAQYRFYTVWSYSILTLYFAVATAHSAGAMWFEGSARQNRTRVKGSVLTTKRSGANGRTADDATASEEDDEAAVIQLDYSPFVHSESATSLTGDDSDIVADPNSLRSAGLATVALFNLVWLNVWVVDTILWCVLYPMYIQMGFGDSVFTWLSINQHAVNMLILGFEALCNRIPVIPQYVAYTILLVLVFTCMELILHDESGVHFSYPFQKLTSAAPAWYAAISLSVFVFQGWVVFLDRVVKRNIVKCCVGDTDEDDASRATTGAAEGNPNAVVDESSSLLR
uniref:Uncharacterized protein n=1 Tax=Pycnococcus provasolii TaxID=41880 RepID=A0A7R9XMY8_9CHLO